MLKLFLCSFGVAIFVVLLNISTIFFDVPLSEFASILHFRQSRPIDRDSVCVPGAGFSGFWYTLGRLQSIPHHSNKTFYCYSAGCLGVVAALNRKSIGDVIDVASKVQGRWKNGSLSRYAVLSEFIEEIFQSDTYELQNLKGINNIDECNITKEEELVAMNDTHLLLEINIITTSRDTNGGFAHTVQRPLSIQHLKHLLVQTTWIPFATGKSFWVQDTRTGSYHMDGAFTALRHPSCQHNMRLPLTMEILLNALNMNMGRELAEKFWNVQRGL